MYIYIYIYISIYRYILIYIYTYAAVSNGKQKMKAQTIFFNPFTICSSYKQKLSVCKWTKRTIRSCPSMKTRYNIVDLRSTRIVLIKTKKTNF